MNDHIDPEISKRQVMKRRRSAALAGAAVLFMTVALAVILLAKSKIEPSLLEMVSNAPKLFRIVRWFLGF